MKKLLIILSAILLAAALSSCADHRGEPAITETQEESTTAAVAAMARIMPEAEPGVIAFDMGIPAFDGVTVGEISLIDRDRAIELALLYAELSPADVFDVEAELEEEPSGTFWDVEFYSGGYEHSYFIDAESGEIVRSGIELDD